MTIKDIHILPVLSDNYVYIIECENGHSIVVDPGESEPIKEFVQAHNLNVTSIILTHHHGDHIAGTNTLRSLYDAKVYGPAKEVARMPAFDVELNDQETVTIEGLEFNIIETPGHTAHHICYYLADENVLFAGDTLFSIGCGRVFEGTMEQMHSSLQFLKQLPDETSVYCGHEYTLSNIEFALSLDPNNEGLVQKLEEVSELRAQNLPSQPFLLGDEKQHNPFLHAKSAEDFADIRRQKDAA